jgi:small-conductance mechanosensitive channel
MANLTPLNFTSNSSFNVTAVQLPFMDQMLWGNTMRVYLVAIIYFLAAVGVMWLFSFLIIKILESICKKKTSRIKEGVIDVFKALQLPLFLIIGIKIASHQLMVHATVVKVMDYILLIVITYYVVRAIIFVVRHASNRVIEKRLKEDKDSDTHLLKFFTKAVYAILWIAAVLFILSQFGVDVSKVLTGLGIAGVAVAFALQSILGDIFASVSIYFDKPFKPGDYVELNDGREGTVIKTGIKSTRIKLLRGEELVISNKDITETRLHNLERMETRRVELDLRVKYGTPKAKLEKIPKMLEAIVKKQKKAEFLRAHLKTFKESSILFELRYQIKGNDYTVYMDIQQAVNLAVIDAFEKEGIEFAFPTQTIHIEGEGKKKGK